MIKLREFNKMERNILQLISVLVDQKEHSITKAELKLIGYDYTWWKYSSGATWDPKSIRVRIEEYFDPDYPNLKYRNYLVINLKFDEIEITVNADHNKIYNEDGKSTDQFFKLWLLNYLADAVICCQT